MNTLDKHYLSLQFKLEIHKKNGLEFQSFFEEIMEKAFSDFQIIRPYGNEGDGGNDGYRKESGIYYQVYAPNAPKVNENKAVKKLNNDFEKLKRKWSEISKIREFYFVYNDKYSGSTISLESTISDLEKNNPEIKFKLFQAKHLEKVFFALNDSNILSLNFNIDQRQAISNAYEYLKNIETELDRENSKEALKRLNDCKEIFLKLNEENLSLNYEIIECRCLQKLEKIDEAKEKYKGIIKRNPDNPFPYLYLAEIYLNNNAFDKNKDLLDKANEIDSNHWLLKLEKLMKKYYAGEEIKVVNIDEKTFPSNPKIKSSFYKLYALFLEKAGDSTKADSFIEKSIRLNPDRFNNYITKLSLLEKRLIINTNTLQTQKKMQEFFVEIETIENMFLEFGDIGVRNKVILNVKKMNILRELDNFLEFKRIFQETFKLIITCYFNTHIEQILSNLLVNIPLSNSDLDKLLKYIKSSKNGYSEGIIKVLIFQFNINNVLFTKGKIFFIEINNQKYHDFINNIENKNHEKVLEFLINNTKLALLIANTLKSEPALRRKIINNLPDKNMQKEKLLLLLNFDENNYDEAFNILKQYDLKKMNYFECNMALEIFEKKKAWDFAIIILQKLLEKERNEEKIFNFKLQLFNSYWFLKKYSEVIDIGVNLLKEDSVMKLIDLKNKEALCANTILACFERGKINNESYKKSKEILEKNPLTEPSFEFKVAIEAEVYLNNDEPNNAIKSIFEGVKIKKILNLKEYSNLYFLVFIKIGNQIDLKIGSLNFSQENTFIKLMNNDKWYFIGEDNELDAIKITKSNNLYSIYINKKIGEKINLKKEYSSDSISAVIENILSIENYILWQINHNFYKLSKVGVLDNVHEIEVINKKDTFEPKYLIKYFEDQLNTKEPFFKMYCNSNIPLAMLALSEGGLTNAIGRIQQEKRGYINFSTGSLEEFSKQKDIAKKILDNEMQFYLDGTSALILAETYSATLNYPLSAKISTPQYFLKN